MYEKILHEMRARVRRGNLAITFHGRREMFNDHKPMTIRKSVNAGADFIL